MNLLKLFAIRDYTYWPFVSQDRIKLNPQLIAVLGKIADKSLTPGSTEVPMLTGYAVAE